MAGKPKVRIKDDPTVREVTATHVPAGMVVDSTIFLTFASLRVLPEKTDEPPQGAPQAHVTARLALTPTAAVELVNTLNQLLSVMPGVSFDPPGKKQEH